MKLTAPMRIAVLFVLGTTIGIMCAGSQLMQTSTPKSTPTLADLAWMSGDWQTAAEGRAQVEEHWTTPAGGTMLGMGRTIVEDKTVEFEYLRVEQRTNGIYYVASPQGGNTTDFKLTRVANQEAVFENPDHDFPKRIIYSKNSDGSLIASIDAGEKTKSQTFAYLPFRK